MLILTRKTGQGFRVGDNIEITITEVSGDKVRVGISAPREIKVLRSELSETMEANVQASSPAGLGSLKALAKGLAGTKKAGGGTPVTQPVKEVKAVQSGERLPG